MVHRSLAHMIGQTACRPGPDEQCGLRGASAGGVQRCMDLSGSVPGSPGAMPAGGCPVLPSGLPSGMQKGLGGFQPSCLGSPRRCLTEWIYRGSLKVSLILRPGHFKTAFWNQGALEYLGPVPLIPNNGRWCKSAHLYPLLAANRDV